MTDLVIVNADDFGMSLAVNEGIRRGFETGLISSASIMTNMPAFEEACDIARKERFSDRIGLHFNLTEGTPLSSQIRDCPKFCGPGGEFVFSRISGMRLSQLEQAAVAEELRAQWRACTQNGISPTHLDTHRHVHTAWGIASVIIRLRDELGIPAVRTHWNVVPSPNLLKRIYIGLINKRFWNAGLAATRFGAETSQGALAIRKRQMPLEIMVHPILSSDGRVVDRLEDRALDEIVAEFGCQQGFVSFGEIKT
jgi:predicted glycoside hydrolase/deacetylase ChbG (UPF0249 family)